MVSARFTTYLLVFILLLLRFSNAHNHHQGKKSTLVGAKLETTSSPMKVEIYHGVPAVAETDQRTRFLLAERKMMSRGVMSKSNVVEAENGVNMARGLSLTTKWKARCEIKNCNLKVSKRKNGRSMKVKMSGLVPLNADYYVPRPHPPKNN